MDEPPLHKQPGDPGPADAIRWVVPHPSGHTRVDLEGRRRQLDSLLQTALGGKGEYLHEGEMSSYVRFQAADAAVDLGFWIEQGGLTEDEAALCVEEISRADRIAGGRSGAMLNVLGDYGGPLLAALARSPDPAVRRFAIEAAGEPEDPLDTPEIPLSPVLKAVPELLDDPDEEVRLSAVSSLAWLREDNDLILRSLPDRDHEVMEVYRRLLRRLEDPSPRVRAAAARTLGSTVPEAARPALRSRLAAESEAGVRAALQEAIAMGPEERAPAAEALPASPERLKRHLEALASGAVWDAVVRYRDVHPLWGGTDFFLGTDGRFERVEHARGCVSRSTRSGDVAVEQLRALARLLVEIRVWEARPQQRMPVPDETCMTLTVRAGEVETSMRQWKHDAGAKQGLERVRALLSTIGEAPPHP